MPAPQPVFPLHFGDPPLGAQAAHQRLRRRRRPVLAVVLLFSVIANLLMLASPLYMLQIYERILPSRSVPSLIALSVLMLFFFTIMTVLDLARARLLSRIGMMVPLELGPPLSAAALARPEAEAPLALILHRDLEVMQRFWASPLMQALIDLPWVPLFVGLLFLFHPLLGLFALAAGLMLLGLSLLQYRQAAPQVAALHEANARTERFLSQMMLQADTIRALSMQAPVQGQWQQTRETLIGAMLRLGDLALLFQITTRNLRLLLQSAILGLGAWLALQGEINAGTMVAASIIMGRALAPVEQLVAQWENLPRARDARRRLHRMIEHAPDPTPPMMLPRPKPLLAVEGVSLLLTGTPEPVLRNLRFILSPGEILGVIGPSGAGKTSLMRAVLGLVAPAGGRIRLDGAEIAQYPPEDLGRHIGYLPYQAQFLETTIARNIAHFAEAYDPEQVVMAARKAEVHDMILRQPQGYNTRLDGTAPQLSAGMLQRLAFARALYHDPVLLVLDEPDAHLDPESCRDLARQLTRFKEEGKAILLVSHRQQMLQACDRLLLLRAGHCEALGPREEVLRIARHLPEASAA